MLLRRVGAELLGLASLGNKKFGRTLNLRTLKKLRVPVFSRSQVDQILSLDADRAKTAAQKAAELESLIWEDPI